MTPSFAQPTPQGGVRVRTAAAPTAAPLGPNHLLARWRPSAKSPWTAAKARHLMRRAGFGASPAEIEAIVALGVDRSIDLLLATPSSHTLPTSGLVRLPNGEAINVSQTRGGRQHWLWELAQTRHPLLEKMTMFWHDFFSVGAKDAAAQSAMVQHTNVMRKHGLGRWRDLLIEVSRDPAMLLFLDNQINGRPVNGVPRVNENYGREFLELYTLGVNSGYSQRDVIETSKVFSGWSLSGARTYIFKPAWHVAGDKVVLGTRIRSGGEQEVFDLIDQVILPRAGSNEYVVRRIWEYFVAPSPAPDLVAELARRFRSGGQDIRKLMALIFRSNAFFSRGTEGALVKNPAESLIGNLRSTSSPVRSTRLLEQSLRAMAMPLLEYGSPFGSPDGLAWMDEMSSLERANAANQLVSQRSAWFRVFDEVLRKRLDTADKVVDHFLGTLGGPDVPRSVRTALRTFMDADDSGFGSKFELKAAKVRQKVTGLVHLILSLPQAQLN